MVGQISAASPDITAIVTNLGIFSLAIGAVVGGVWRGLKNVRKVGYSPDRPTSQLAAATIMETTTLLMWSESNRDVCKSIDQLVDVLQDHRSEITELRHQMERLRDKL